MPSHCRCCSGKFLKNDVLGDCPGCPECSEKDAEIARLTLAHLEAEQSLLTVTGERYAALQSSTLRVVESHCLNSHLCQNCGFPVTKHSMIELQYCLSVISVAKRTLNKENDVLSDAMKLKDAEIAALQAATRRVVEAAREADDFMSKHAAPWFSSGEMVLIQHRLRDAIAFVALGRE